MVAGHAIYSGSSKIKTVMAQNYIINSVYNGQDLVYKISKTKVFEKSAAGTYSVTLSPGIYHMIVIAGGGVRVRTENTYRYTSGSTIPDGTTVYTKRITGIGLSSRTVANGTTSADCGVCGGYACCYTQIDETTTASVVVGSGGSEAYTTTTTDLYDSSSNKIGELTAIQYGADGVSTNGKGTGTLSSLTWGSNNIVANPGDFEYAVSRRSDRKYNYGYGNLKAVTPVYYPRRNSGAGYNGSAGSRSPVISGTTYGLCGVESHPGGYDGYVLIERVE